VLHVNNLHLGGSGFDRLSLGKTLTSSKIEICFKIKNRVYK